MSSAFKRIAVVGCSGGGKTTVSRAVAESLDLPVVSLDAHFWLPGWQQPAPEEWSRTVEELVARPAWVMDGTYLSTIDRTLAAAQVVIDIDLPRMLCLLRVVRRWLGSGGRPRADMAPGCPEKVDRAFVRYIWRFPKHSRPRLDAAERKAAKPVLRIRSSRQLTAFIAGLPATLGS